MVGESVIALTTSILVMWTKMKRGIQSLKLSIHT